MAGEAGRARRPLIGDHIHVVDALHDRVRCLGPGDSDLIVLSSESGWGKTRVIQELYERLAEQQALGHGFWPTGQVAPLSDGASLDQWRLQRKRVAAVESIDRTTSPSYLWLGASGARHPDGRAGSALSSLLEQIELLALHPHAAEERRKARRRGATTIVDVVASQLPVVANIAGVVELMGRIDQLRAAIDTGRSVSDIRSGSRVVSTEELLRARREETVAVMRESFALLSQAAGSKVPLPVVIVVDDAHDADDETLTMLEALLHGERPRKLRQTARYETPILVVLACWEHRRSSTDPFSKWIDRQVATITAAHPDRQVVVAADSAGNHDPVRLSPLGRRDAEEMLAELLPKASEGLVKSVIEQLAGADGANPAVVVLAAERLRGALAVGQEITGDDLERLDRRLDEEASRRFEGLGSPVHQTLALASRVGPAFPAEAVTGELSIAGLTARHLDAACAAGVIRRPSEADPGAVWEFVDDWVHSYARHLAESVGSIDHNLARALDRGARALLSADSRIGSTPTIQSALDLVAAAVRTIAPNVLEQFRDLDLWSRAHRRELLPDGALPGEVSATMEDLLTSTLSRQGMDQHLRLAIVSTAVDLWVASGGHRGSSQSPASVVDLALPESMSAGRYSASSRRLAVLALALPVRPATRELALDVAENCLHHDTQLALGLVRSSRPARSVAIEELVRSAADETSLLLDLFDVLGPVDALTESVATAAKDDWRCALLMLKIGNDPERAEAWRMLEEHASNVEAAAAEFVRIALAADPPAFVGPDGTRSAEVLLDDWLDRSPTLALIGLELAPGDLGARCWAALLELATSNPSAAIAGLELAAEEHHDELLALVTASAEHNSAAALALLERASYEQRPISWQRAVRLARNDPDLAAALVRMAVGDEEISTVQSLIAAHLDRGDVVAARGLATARRLTPEVVEVLQRAMEVDPVAALVLLAHPGHRHLAVEAVRQHLLVRRIDVFGALVDVAEPHVAFVALDGSGQEPSYLDWCERQAREDHHAAGMWLAAAVEWDPGLVPRAGEAVFRWVKRLPAAARWLSEPLPQVLSAAAVSASVRSYGETHSVDVATALVQWSSAASEELSRRERAWIQAAIRLGSASPTAALARLRLADTPALRAQAEAALAYSTEDDDSRASVHARLTAAVPLTELQDEVLRQYPWWVPAVLDPTVALGGRLSADDEALVAAALDPSQDHGRSALVAAVNDDVLRTTRVLATFLQPEQFVEAVGRLVTGGDASTADRLVDSLAHVARVSERAAVVLGWLSVDLFSELQGLAVELLLTAATRSAAAAEALARLPITDRQRKEVLQSIAASFDATDDAQDPDSGVRPGELARAELALAAESVDRSCVSGILSRCRRHLPSADAAAAVAALAGSSSAVSWEQERQRAAEVLLSHDDPTPSQLIALSMLRPHLGAKAEGRMVHALQTHLQRGGVGLAIAALTAARASTLPHAEHLERQALKVLRRAARWSGAAAVAAASAEESEERATLLLAPWMHHDVAACIALFELAPDARHQAALERLGAFDPRAIRVLVRRADEADRARLWQAWALLARGRRREVVAVSKSAVSTPEHSAAFALLDELEVDHIVLERMLHHLRSVDQVVRARRNVIGSLAGHRDPALLLTRLANAPVGFLQVFPPHEPATRRVFALLDGATDGTRVRALLNADAGRPIAQADREWASGAGGKLAELVAALWAQRSEGESAPEPTDPTVVRLLLERSSSLEQRCRWLMAEDLVDPMGTISAIVRSDRAVELLPTLIESPATAGVVQAVNHLGGGHALLAVLAQQGVLRGDAVVAVAARLEPDEAPDLWEKLLEQPDSPQVAVAMARHAVSPEQLDLAHGRLDRWLDSDLDALVDAAVDMLDDPASLLGVLARDSVTSAAMLRRADISTDSDWRPLVLVGLVVAHHRFLPPSGLVQRLLALAEFACPAAVSAYALLTARNLPEQRQAGELLLWWMRGPDPMRIVAAEALCFRSGNHPSEAEGAIRDVLVSKRRLSRFAVCLARRVPWDERSELLEGHVEVSAEAAVLVARAAVATSGSSEEAAGLLRRFAMQSAEAAFALAELHPWDPLLPAALQRHARSHSRAARLLARMPLSALDRSRVWSDLVRLAGADEELLAELIDRAETTSEHQMVWGVLADRLGRSSVAVLRALLQVQNARQLLDIVPVTDPAARRLLRVLRGSLTPSEVRPAVLLAPLVTVLGPVLSPLEYRKISDSVARARQSVESDPRLVEAFVRAGPIGDPGWAHTTVRKLLASGEKVSVPVVGLAARSVGTRSDARLFTRAVLGSVLSDAQKATVLAQIEPVDPGEILELLSAHADVSEVAIRLARRAGASADMDQLIRMGTTESLGEVLRAGLPGRDRAAAALARAAQNDVSAARVVASTDLAADHVAVLSGWATLDLDVASGLIGHGTDDSEQIQAIQMLVAGNPYSGVQCLLRRIGAARTATLLAGSAAAVDEYVGCEMEVLRDLRQNRRWADSPTVAQTVADLVELAVSVSPWWTPAVRSVVRNWVHEPIQRSLLLRRLARDPLHLAEADAWAQPDGSVRSAQAMDSSVEPPADLLIGLEAVCDESVPPSTARKLLAPAIRADRNQVFGLVLSRNISAVRLLSVFGADDQALSWFTSFLHRRREDPAAAILYARVVGRYYPVFVFEARVALRRAARNDVGAARALVEMPSTDVDATFVTAMLDDFVGAGTPVQRADAAAILVEHRLVDQSLHDSAALADCLRSAAATVDRMAALLTLDRLDAAAEEYVVGAAMSGDLDAAAALIRVGDPRGSEIACGIVVSKEPAPEQAAMLVLNAPGDRELAASVVPVLDQVPSSLLGDLASSDSVDPSLLGAIVEVMRRRAATSGDSYSALVLAGISSIDISERKAGLAEHGTDLRCSTFLMLLMDADEPGLGELMDRVVGGYASNGPTVANTIAVAQSVMPLDLAIARLSEFAWRLSLRSLVHFVEMLISGADSNPRLAIAAYAVCDNVASAHRSRAWNVLLQHLASDHSLHAVAAPFLAAEHLRSIERHGVAATWSSGIETPTDHQAPVAHDEVDAVDLEHRDVESIVFQLQGARGALRANLIERLRFLADTGDEFAQVAAPVVQAVDALDPVALLRPLEINSMRAILTLALLRLPAPTLMRLLWPYPDYMTDLMALMRERALERSDPYYAETLVDLAAENDRPIADGAADVLRPFIDGGGMPVEFDRVAATRGERVEALEYLLDACDREDRRAIAAVLRDRTDLGAHEHRAVARVARVAASMLADDPSLCASLVELAAGPVREQAIDRCLQPSWLGESDLTAVLRAAKADERPRLLSVALARLPGSSEVGRSLTPWLSDSTLAPILRPLLGEFAGDPSIAVALAAYDSTDLTDPAYAEARATLAERPAELARLVAELPSEQLYVVTPWLSLELKHDAVLAAALRRPEIRDLAASELMSTLESSPDRVHLLCALPPFSEDEQARLIALGAQRLDAPVAALIVEWGSDRSSEELVQRATKLLATVRGVGEQSALRAMLLYCTTVDELLDALPEQRISILHSFAHRISQMIGRGMVLHSQISRLRRHWAVRKSIERMTAELQHLGPADGRQRVEAELALATASDAVADRAVGHSDNDEVWLKAAEPGVLPVGSEVRFTIERVFPTYLVIKVPLSDYSELALTGVSKRQTADMAIEGQVRSGVVGSIDPAARRLFVSQMPFGNAEFDAFAAAHDVGDRLQGIVSRHSGKGVHFALVPGVEGLVHRSAFGDQSAYPDVGSSAELVVTSLDRSDRWVHLSLADGGADPWERFVEAHEIGAEVTGTVTNVANFGIFVRFDEFGFDGLVHRTEMPTELAGASDLWPGPGDSLEVWVRSVDDERRRISLSMVHPSAWEQPTPDGPDPWGVFLESHGVGDSVTGTVTNQVDYGVFVRLAGSGVVGLLHQHEMPAEMSEASGLWPGIGGELDVWVRSVDEERRRLALSLHPPASWA